MVCFECAGFWRWHHKPLQPTTHDSQGFSMNKQTWPLLSHMCSCKNILHIHRLTVASLIQAALLARATTIICTFKGKGSPPAHTGLWGQRTLPAIAWEKTCSQYRILKAHHCLVVVGSSHIAEVLSFCPPLKIHIFLACFYFYFFASSQ